MSHGQPTFVAVSSNSSNDAGSMSSHSSNHSPTLASLNCPGVIITSSLDNHEQQVTPAETPHGDEKTGSDDCHKGQQCADSSKDSVLDNQSSPNKQFQPSSATDSSPELVRNPDAASNNHSETTVNGYSSSVSSKTSKSLSRIADTSSEEASSLEELDKFELRQLSQRPVRQVFSDIPYSMTRLERRRCSQSLTDAKEHAYARMMAELSNAQRELRLKDEECEKLSNLRSQMEHELDELTAALFEEANKMVQDANIKRMHVEKRLEDANHQIDILQGEVAALKHLVVTSTPAMPNKHLHPQICEAGPKKEKSAKPFWKSHRRSTSHHEFTKESREQAEEAHQEESKVKEMDPVCFEEFQQWKRQPSVIDSSSPFLSRLVEEDIQPCLNFYNSKLAERILQCVQRNTLTIEPITGDVFARRCSLSDSRKQCNYKIKLEETEDWYSITQMCRNRIAAVCDLYTYIRYISQGLVKCTDKDMFQEILNLRHQMAKSRLGC